MESKIATLQSVSQPHADIATESQELRKLHRRLAKLYELQKQVRKSFDDNIDGFTPSETVLIQKIFPHNRPLHTLECLKLCREQITACKNQRDQIFEKRKVDALTRWKARIRQPDLSHLGKWLKQKEQHQVYVNIFDKDGFAHTDHESCEKIYTHWESVWNEQTLTPQVVAERLTQDFGICTQGQWNTPDFDALLKSVRHCSGNGGPDLWSSEEIKDMPEKAIATWYKLTLRWLEIGELPQQLRQVRMTNLIKPNKIQNKHWLDIADTRPLSVMSIFWRIYANMWHNSQSCKDWIVANVPAEIGCHTGAAGSEEIMNELQDVYSTRNGFLATLDWSQTYDRMDAHATGTFLKQIGWPPKLIRLMTLAWDHDRFVCWNQNYLPRPLPAKVTPQGCPLAPIALLCWTVAGFKWVKAQSGPGPAVTTRIYMDDRSFHSTDLERILTTIDVWNRWSIRVSLKENTKKTQICGKTKQNKATLDLLCPQQWKRSEVEILGVCSLSNRRKYTHKEEGRIKKAFSRANLLKSCHLDWNLLHLAFRWFITPVVCYGWSVRLPTCHTTDQLFNKFSVISQQQYHASSDLRKILYGGAIHIQLQAASNLLRRIVRMKVRSDSQHLLRIEPEVPLIWQHKPHTSLGCLHRFLVKQGWTSISPWKYRHSSTRGFISERMIDLQKPFEVEKNLHALRTQWRYNILDSFLNSGRREASDLLSRKSKDNIFRDFSFIDLKVTRSALISQGTARHIMLAAFNSDSVLNVIDPRKFSGVCSICGKFRGTFHHLFYVCPHFGTPLHVPTNCLTYRFGWISSDHNCRDSSHLEAMKARLEALWHIRHAPT